MSVLPEYVVDLIHTISKSEGFTKYETKFANGSNHGDGFVCTMTSVTITGIRQIKNQLMNDEIYLLCKEAPPSQARRKEFQTDKLFKREAAVYNDILPNFVAFQRTKGLSEADGYFSFPKCYAAIADEEKNQFVIIMEDLRPQGFSMLPKQRPAPIDHYYLIVEQLAKLHGISFALKDQQPDIYGNLRKYDDIFRSYFKPDSSLLELLGFERAMATLKDERHIAIVRELKEHTTEYFEDCFGNNAAEPFGAIIHADCHNNNILYEYIDGVRHTKYSM